MKTFYQKTFCGAYQRFPRPWGFVMKLTFGSVKHFDSYFHSVRSCTQCPYSIPPAITQLASEGRLVASLTITKHNGNPKHHNGLKVVLTIVCCQIQDLNK